MDEVEVRRYGFRKGLFFLKMPNHITNRIILQGEELEIKNFVEKFSNHYPEQENKSYNGLFIYKTANGDIGWLDKESNVFTRRGKDAVLGVPIGFHVDMIPKWSRFPDFEKVYPVPNIIKEVGDSVNSTIVNAVYKKYTKGYSHNSLLAFLEMENRKHVEIRPEDQFQFEKACKAYEQTGFCYWYDFNQEKWGTKWNAYNCSKLSQNVYTFQTAWSDVMGIIVEMSKCFSGKINYSFADEDTSYNVGIANICKGIILTEEYPEGGSKEAFDLYFELNPDDLQNYRLVEGNYQYFGEESEGL